MEIDRPVIDASELLTWVYTTTGVRCSSFAQLSDGSILSFLMSSVFPAVSAFDFEQQAVGQLSHGWERVYAVCTSLQIPDGCVRKRDIANGDHTACYSALVMLFFLGQLSNCASFTCDFTDEVDAVVSTFLQSLDSVRTLVLGGALSIESIPRDIREKIRSSLPSGQPFSAHASEGTSPQQKYSKRSQVEMNSQERSYLPSVEGSRSPDQYLTTHDASGEFTATGDAGSWSKLCLALRAQQDMQVEQFLSEMETVHQAHAEALMCVQALVSSDGSEAALQTLRTSIDRAESHALSERVHRMSLTVDALVAAIGETLTSEKQTKLLADAQAQRKEFTESIVRKTNASLRQDIESIRCVLMNDDKLTTSDKGVPVPSPNVVLWRGEERSPVRFVDVSASFHEELLRLELRMSHDTGASEHVRNLRREFWILLSMQHVLQSRVATAGKTIVALHDKLVRLRHSHSMLVESTREHQHQADTRHRIAVNALKEAHAAEISFLRDESSAVRRQQSKGDDFFREREKKWEALGCALCKLVDATVASAAAPDSSHLMVAEEKRRALEVEAANHFQSLQGEGRASQGAHDGQTHVALEQKCSRLAAEVSRLERQNATLLSEKEILRAELEDTLRRNVEEVERRCLQTAQFMEERDLLVTKLKASEQSLREQRCILSLPPPPTPSPVPKRYGVRNDDDTTPPRIHVDFDSPAP
jgi:hypothetical protein